MVTKGFGRLMQQQRAACRAALSYWFEASDMWKKLDEEFARINAAERTPFDCVEAYVVHELSRQFRLLAGDPAPRADGGWNGATLTQAVIQTAKIIEEGGGQPPLEEALRSLLNSYSREGVSNSPDFVLADYLMNVLDAYDRATQERDRYFGLTPPKMHAVAGHRPEDVEELRRMIG